MIKGHTHLARARMPPPHTPTEVCGYAVAPLYGTTLVACSLQPLWPPAPIAATRNQFETIAYQPAEVVDLRFPALVPR